MSTMPSLIAQLMQMAESNYRDLFQIHITTVGDFSEPASVQ